MVKVGHDPGHVFLQDHRLGQHPGKRCVCGQLPGKLGKEQMGDGKPGTDAAAIKILQGKKRLRSHGGPRIGR